MFKYYSEGNLFSCQLQQNTRRYDEEEKSRKTIFLLILTWDVKVDYRFFDHGFTRFLLPQMGWLLKVENFKAENFLAIKAKKEGEGALRPNGTLYIKAKNSE